MFKRIDTMEKSQLEDLQSSKWTQRLKTKMNLMHTHHADRTSTKKATSATQQHFTQQRASRHQARVKQSRLHEIRSTRGLSPTRKPPLEIQQQTTLELPGIRLVDFAPVRPAAIGTKTGNDAATTTAVQNTVITVNGARLKPVRVLNPSERELDETIWLAVRQNDFSAFFRIFQNPRPEIRANPARFQRPVDGVTILMAAAVHNRADVIEALLRPEAADVLQEDWCGATAAAVAKRHGHTSIEAALRACEDAEREKEFVYDVYCVDVAASKTSDAMAMQDGDGHTADDAAAVAAANTAPVVSVTPAVHKWLSQEATHRFEQDGDQVDEYMLESDVDSNEEVDGCV